MDEKYFISHDNTEIFYRHQYAWNKKAIVILHRWHEHSGRVDHIPWELWLSDYDYFAWDARGNGRTKWKRWYAPDFWYFVKDLDVFVKHISAQYDIPSENIVIIAQSVWAVIASTWTHDYAPNIAWAVLASPAFNVNLIVPWAKRALQLWQKIRGDFTVKSYVKWKHLTHDDQRAKSYHEDSLVSLEISSNILLELYDHAHRVVQDAWAIHTPVLLLSSGDDKVVFQKEQDLFFENLSSDFKQHYILEGFYHDTLWEKERKIPLDYIREFIAQLENHKIQIDISQADKAGYSYDEYQKLQAKLPTLSYKNLYYGVIKFSMKHIGKYFSKWLFLWEKVGYDSGSMLDYVYENTPIWRGVWWYNLIGKLIDRAYLESVGWKWIRQRKIHLGKAISQCITESDKDKTQVKLLDIAAWHGRYILDAIEPHREKISSLLLRDYSDINVTAWNKMIAQRWLDEIATFVNADAFDKENIANIQPKVNITIVSGLYELFPDNAMVQESLEGVYSATQQGGYLIYTNQPWHPQLELIARTLKSHQSGKPWIMRRRTQLEMDTLVKNAWFEKREQYIDKWWIFTVCVAQKV